MADFGNASRVLVRLLWLRPEVREHMLELARAYFYLNGEIRPKTGGPKMIPPLKKPPDGYCCHVGCDNPAAISISTVVPLDEEGRFATGTVYPCAEHAYQAVADVTDLALEVIDDGIDAIKKRQVDDD